jgi:hypothetical protein
LGADARGCEAVTITKTTRGRIEIDVSGTLDWLSAQIVGIIQRRTGNGIGSDGGPFARYSDSYAETLGLMAESTNVDLTLTGAYVASISERSRTVTATGGTIVIGPGTGTSEQMAPRYTSAQQAARTARAERRRAKAYRLAEGMGLDIADDVRRDADRKFARSQVGGARKTGQRSPPHNVLGAYLHHGTPRMPARPHLGLTPDEGKRLAARMVKLLLKQGR